MAALAMVAWSLHALPRCLAERDVARQIGRISSEAEPERSTADEVPGVEVPDPTTPAGKVFDALRLLQDPELKVSVVDLGLIREVTIDDQGRTRVKLLLTTPTCPYRDVLIRGVESVASAARPEHDVLVELDRSRAWSEADLTAAGRRQLLGSEK